MKFISSVKNFLRRLFGGFGVIERKQELRGSIYDNIKTKIVEEIHNVWDFLKFRENTQAFHLQAVIGFDDWITMSEIQRRIKEIFGIEYKNDRSLYPYLKALVDTGLFETLDIEGKRKWRKKAVIIKIKKEILKKDEEDKKIIVKEKIDKKKIGENFVT